MSSLTGSRGCELQGQVGTVWSKRPLSWRRVVFVGLFQEVRSWQNEQVSSFHAGPSAGPHLPPGWRVDGVGGGSFPPKAARSVLRKPGPCCSFYLHCTSQGRALCLPQGQALCGHTGQVDTGAAQPWNEWWIWHRTVCSLGLCTLSR